MAGPRRQVTRASASGRKRLGRGHGESAAVAILSVVFTHPTMATTYANPLLAGPSRPMPKSIGIIGAGTIGPDIGYYLKSELSDLKLVLVDRVPEALERARSRIEAYVKKGRARGKLSEKQAASVTENLVTTLDYGELAECDWVIEAATEDLPLKRRIFAQLEEVLRPEALITSNTSSLPASRMFSELAHPERATVTHFFAPAFKNPAVEVVQWDGTDPAVVEFLRWFFCATGKVPLVTKDAVCFMLDRVFDNWCNEAAYLLDDGIAAAEVDSVATELVHAGPFFVLNLAHGNPIIIETNTLQMEEEGEHYRPAPILRSVETWRTGAPGKAVEVDSETASQIRDRLRGVLFSQSVDILDREIGSKSDLDLGCLLALGFKKGPLSLMGELGGPEVERILGRFAEDRSGMPMPASSHDAYVRFRKHVLVDDVLGVKVLTMRRPQAMNALDDEVTDELLAVIREHEAEPDVLGFVITGYGPKAFCAGADIGRFPELLGDEAEATEFARSCSRLLVHLDQMKKPVVAAINGMALGGGFELAMRCHSLVATRGAWFQLPEVTLGIAPGIGAMVVPYRRWPKANLVFHDMIRLAKKLDARAAAELGVVDRLADDYSELIRVAVERVRELGAAGVSAPADGSVTIEPLAPVDAASGKRPLSAEVIGIIEAAIAEAAAAPTFSAALEGGYRAFGRTACTAAAREGIGAFSERRKPDFTKTG